MAAQDGQATSPLERSGALVDTGARQERLAEVALAETEALVAIGADQGMSVASTLALVDTAVRAKSKAKDLVKSTKGMEGKGTKVGKAAGKAKAKTKAKGLVKSTEVAEGKSTMVGKAAGKAKAKTKAKGSVKSTMVAEGKSTLVGKVKGKAKAKAKAKTARIDHEGSRQQFLVRCSGEKSQQFPYTDDSSHGRALKAAKKHCLELCALHGLKIPKSAT